MARFFYSAPDFGHNDLRELILKKVQPVLDANEVDLMIDHLARHGILTDYSVAVEDNLLHSPETFYSFSFQSIIEHILSENIYADIRQGNLEAIPPVWHQRMNVSVKETQPSAAYDVPPNQRIIQFIVNRLFMETGKLIGDEGFLTAGFTDELILELRLTALKDVPKDLSARLAEEVKGLFFSGPYKQWMVLKHLIVPCCHLSGTAFGALFLHSLLMPFPNAFERDKVWSGVDPYEDHSAEGKEFNNNIKNLLDPFDTNQTVLLGFEKFDEIPLLFAWALSNVDENLRHAIRTSLATWGTKNPQEFVELLDTIFNCNDPQIQEDLAAIPLGIATNIKDPQGAKAISDWAVEIVFKQSLIFRNVIIRQGFRAIVEKASLMGLVSAEHLALARPRRQNDLRLLDLDEDVLRTGGRERYPITEISHGM